VSVVAVELVGGPLDGGPAVASSTFGVLPTHLFGRYVHTPDVGDVVRDQPRYVYDYPRDGERRPSSCECGQPGCPNYGTAAA
jgi:hypothetical protein